MLSIPEKLSKALEYKNIGNEKFNQGKYKSAISKYGTVLAYIRGLPGSKRNLEGIAKMAASATYNNTENIVTPEEDFTACEIEKLALQNIANCYIKLNQPRDAIEFCNKALLIDSCAWKVN